MSRKRHPTIRTGMELPMPAGDLARGEDPAKPSRAAMVFENARVELEPPAVMITPLEATQLDRANALARAREEGFRDGEIAGSLATLEPFLDAMSGVGPGDQVQLELHAAARDLVRRYGARLIELAAAQRSTAVQRVVAIVIAQRNQEPKE